MGYSLMNIIGKIYISQILMHKLNIPPQPYIKIRTGNKVATCGLEITNHNKESYTLSPALANALLVKKKSLLIRYDEKNSMIHLGPIIGILAAALPNRSEYDPKSTQAELIYLSNMGKKMGGYVFFFTPTCVNFENNTIKGYVYNPNPGRGVWVPSTYPFPDVIYDRISSRRTELKHDEVKHKLMSQPYLKYFNPSFLNKWKVHKLLIQEPSLKGNLPDTMELTKDNMDLMLNLYNIVFVKPSDGSLGQGIIRVSKGEKGSLNYTVYRKKRSKKLAKNTDDFMVKTKNIRGDKEYIVQQGLDLATYRGSPFDLRIIYQKNGSGEWVITKKFVRVAAKGSNVSNLSIGGKAEVSKKVFRFLFKKSELIEAKNEEIKNLCHKIATTLERVSKQTYGELGLDIGIDKKGIPWLIEVNSKPRKTTETDFSMVIVKNTFTRPLEYANYLAGFVQ